jgi:hypothetical protein
VSNRIKFSRREFLKITGAAILGMALNRLLHPIKEAKAQAFSPLRSGPARYYIFLDSTDYKVKALNELTDNVEFSAAYLDPVLTYVISQQIGAYIQEGTYELSPGFTGWNLTGSYISLEFSTNAHIQIPYGYTGYVFNFRGNAIGCLIYGGQFQELNATGHADLGTTQQRKWDFALFTNTVAGNSIYRTIVSDCGNWVHFLGANPGDWFNNNIFLDNETWYPVVWINFEWQPVSFRHELDGANNNLFLHNFCEATKGQEQAITIYGVKDVHGSGNLFINCSLLDLSNNNGNGKYSSITANSYATQIIGGSLTSSIIDSWSDNGRDTMILDQWTKKLPYIQVGTNSSEGRANFGANFATNFGANSPATTVTTPYTWLKFMSNDGSIVWVPAWK